MKYSPNPSWLQLGIQISGQRNDETCRENRSQVKHRSIDLAVYKTIECCTMPVKSPGAICSNNIKTFMTS